MSARERCALWRRTTCRGVDSAIYWVVHWANLAAPRATKLRTAVQGSPAWHAEMPTVQQQHSRVQTPLKIMSPATQPGMAEAKDPWKERSSFPFPLCFPCAGARRASPLRIFPPCSFTNIGGLAPQLSTSGGLYLRSYPSIPSPSFPPPYLFLLWYPLSNRGNRADHTTRPYDYRICRESITCVAFGGERNQVLAPVEGSAANNTPVSVVAVSSLFGSEIVSQQIRETHAVPKHSHTQRI